MSDRYEAALRKIAGVPDDAVDVSLETSTYGGGDVQISEYTWDHEEPTYELTATWRNAEGGKYLHKTVEWDSFTEALRAVLDADTGEGAS